MYSWAVQSYCRCMKDMEMPSVEAIIGKWFNSTTYQNQGVAKKKSLTCELCELPIWYFFSLLVMHDRSFWQCCFSISYGLCRGAPLRKADCWWWFVNNWQLLSSHIHFSSWSYLYRTDFFILSMYQPVNVNVGQTLAKIAPRGLSRSPLEWLSGRSLGAILENN